MDALSAKVSSTLDFCEKVLRENTRPCVLWSGGKDSTVMLHLLRFGLGVELPVVCWKEPWYPRKLQFIFRLIQEWNLETYDYAPSSISLCAGNGRVDVLQKYQISSFASPSPDYLTLARGTTEPGVESSFLCGLTSFLSRPTGSFDFTWNCMFHGHKSVDSDPCSGDIPLSVSFVQNPLGAAAAFPLRNWTDEDVFEYARQYDVPLDENRYDAASGQTKSDKTLNSDYYSACFRCVDPSKPSSVFCPKYQTEVVNRPDLVAWESPSAAYCNLRVDSELGPLFSWKPTTQTSKE
jgi:hypothetical protein